MSVCTKRHDATMSRRDDTGYILVLGADWQWHGDRTGHVLRRTRTYGQMLLAEHVTIDIIKVYSYTGNRQDSRQDRIGYGYMYCIAIATVV